MTALDPRADLSAAPAPGGRGPWFVVGQYVALTKPRIIELLLITTVPVMFLAAAGRARRCGWSSPRSSAGPVGRRRQHPELLLDRDIDAIMHRTSNRPLVTGTVSPRAALVFGIALAVASTLWLGLLVNWLSAWLALGALLFYVVVYTMLLKRRTAQNIVWGGAAGCMPVLIGWSAVTGSLSLGRRSSSSPSSSSGRRRTTGRCR